MARPLASAEAARVRRVFRLFAETGSGVETMRRLRDEGITSKSGRPLNKGDVYKLLNNRTYAGEVAHKGKAYPGEHQAIVPRDLWDAAHAILRECRTLRPSPPERGPRTSRWRRCSSRGRCGRTCGRSTAS